MAAAALMIAHAANAEMLGNDLRDYCKYYPQRSESTALCMGYIFGSLDSARLLNKMTYGRANCEPYGVTGEQLIAMAIKYLADHPEELHLAAAS
jgi:hypothetical protein